MTNRRTFITQTTLAAGALTVFRPLLSLAGSTPATALTDTLCLLHTADLNGQTLAPANNLYGLGGAAALQSALQNMNTKTSTPLLVHVGNVANAATQSREECLRLYRTLSNAGYDAVVAGESDAAKGRAHFDVLANESKLPVFRTTAGRLLPNNVVRKGRFTVGLINASSVHNSNPATQALMVSKTAASLKESGCNVVVCLAHKMSASAKHRLAKASKDIDVIMGCAEKLSVHNAEIVCNAKGAEVILSRAAAAGATVSCVELTFGPDGERTGFATRNLFVGAENQSPLGLMQKYHLRYA